MPLQGGKDEKDDNKEMSSTTSNNFGDIWM